MSDKIRSALSGAGEELLSAVDEGDCAVLEGIMVDEVEACEVGPDGECDWDGSQELDIGDYGRSGNWGKKPKRRKVRRRVYPVPQIDISRVQRVNFPEGDDLDSSDPESLPISGCEQNNNEEMKQLITENDFI